MSFDCAVIMSCLLRAFATVLLVSSPATMAVASTLVWNNPAGGSWFQSSNWTPTGVPGPADQAVLPDLSVPYTVTIGLPYMTPATVGDLDVAGPQTILDCTSHGLNAKNLTNSGSIVNATGNLYLSLHNRTGGRIGIRDGETLNLHMPTVVNDGVIEIGTSLWTQLRPVGGLSIEGGGSIVLSGEGRIVCGSGNLVNQTSHTIRGMGYVQVDTLVNHGLVEADVAHSFYRLGLPHTVNRGILRASGGGRMSVDAVNAGGIIEGANGTFAYGTLQNLGGVIRARDGDLWFDGGSILNHGGVIQADGGDVHVNAAVNGGTIEAIGGLGTVTTSYASLTDVTFAADAVCDIVEWTTVSGATTFPIQGPVRVLGTLTFSSDYLLDGIDGFVLDGGTLATSGSATLTIGPSQVLAGRGNLDARIDNQGVIRSNGGILNLRNLAKFNHGTIEAHNGIVEISGAGLEFHNAGTLAAAGSPLVIMNGAQIENADGVIRADGPGTVRLANGTTCTVRHGTLDGSGGGSFNVTGTATLEDVTLASGGTLWTLINATTRATGTSFVNQGAVRVATGGTFRVETSQPYLQTAGSTLIEDGDFLAPAGIDLQAGSLNGTGRVSGNVISAGTVAPGASPGTLQIEGDYTQLADGVIEIELGGTDAGEFDRLEITGSATLDGTLRATILAGYAPAAGDRFQVITFHPHHGEFATYQGFDLGSGLVIAKHFGDSGEDLTLSIGPPEALPVPELPELPLRLRIYAAGASLILELPESYHASVRLFDVGGRQAAALVEGALPAGRHRFALAERALPSGVYFARAALRSSHGLEQRTVKVVRTR